MYLKYNKKINDTAKIRIKSLLVKISKPETIPKITLLIFFDSELQL